MGPHPKSVAVPLNATAGALAQLQPAEATARLAPSLPPPSNPSPALVGRGLAGLIAAERCGVDLLLAGHLHQGYTGDVRTHHVTIRRSILVAQAGTLSRRTRGEGNSYDQIRVELPRLEIALRCWHEDGRFRTARKTCFVKERGIRRTAS